MPAAPALTLITRYVITFCLYLNRFASAFCSGKCLTSPVIEGRVSWPLFGSLMRVVTEVNQNCQTMMLYLVYFPLKLEVNVLINKGQKYLTSSSNNKKSIVLVWLHSVFHWLRNYHINWFWGGLTLVGAHQAVLLLLFLAV